MVLSIPIHYINSFLGVKTACLNIKYYHAAKAMLIVWSIPIVYIITVHVQKSIKNDSGFDLDQDLSVIDTDSEAVSFLIFWPLYYCDWSVVSTCSFIVNNLLHIHIYIVISRKNLSQATLKTTRELMHHHHHLVLMKILKAMYHVSHPSQMANVRLELR